jgi:phytoene dehydrogenase-like protein
MSERAEIVVCGAGHNTLVTAGYLAKAGLDVLVLEKNSIIGGGVVSKEIPGAPGFISNPHAQGILLMAANPLITHDELELKSKFGLELIEHDNMYCTQFDDGMYIKQYCDLDRACASIARISEHDADAYRRFARMAAKLLPVLSQGLFVPPPPLGSLLMILDQSREGRFVISEMMNSAYNIIDALFTHERVKLHFLHYVSELMVSPEQNGTGIVPYLLTGLIHSQRPFNIKGGSGRFSESLGRCIKHHGGRVRTNAMVKTILSSNGRATGVRLVDGEEIVAMKGVVGSIHPHDIGRMVMGVDPYVAKQASRAKLSHFGAFNTHVALNEPPRYLGGTEVDSAMMVECVPSSLAAFRRSFDDLRYGRIPEYFDYNVACISQWDDSQVPNPANGSLYLYKFAPLELEDGGNAGWANVKQTWSDRYVKEYSRYTKNMDGNVIAYYSETPQDMYAHNPVFKNGDIFGVGSYLNQFFSYRPTSELGQYRVPGVQGLYLSGPTQHPGGGVTGGGRAVAYAMMSDMGMSLQASFNI